MAQETPWSSISPSRFLRDVATNGPANLTVRARRDVATGLWWELDWRSEDGKRYGREASDLALLLRRAAEAEMAAREEWGRGAEDAPPAR